MALQGTIPWSGVEVKRIGGLVRPLSGWCCTRRPGMSPGPLNSQHPHREVKEDATVTAPLLQ